MACFCPKTVGRSIFHRRGFPLKTFTASSLELQGTTISFPISLKCFSSNSKDARNWCVSNTRGFASLSGEGAAGKYDDDETLNSKSIGIDEIEYPNPNDEGYREFTSGSGQGVFANEHNVKLTPLQKSIITVGSGLSAFLDPTRAGLSMSIQ